MKHAAPIALALAALWGLSSGGAGDERPDELDIPPAPGGDSQALIRDMAAALGLTASWSAFLEAAAMGESGLNPLVGRGVKTGAPAWVTIYASSGEATAAGKAYDRNQERYGGCPWPRSRYSFGSGGLWGEIPANALVAFKGTSMDCADPWGVFYPRPALVMFLEMCRRLMGYSEFAIEPTWGNLRVGGRGARRMGEPEELERQRNGKNKLGDRLEQLGYNRSMVDELVTPLPQRNPLGWLETLESV